jgi:hypothetical protein
MWAENVRAKAHELDMNVVSLMPSQKAAEHILRAIHANQKELTFGSPSEKLLQSINQWFPSIVDRIFGQKPRQIHELMLAQNDNCRRRDAHLNRQ